MKIIDNYYINAHYGTDRKLKQNKAIISWSEKPASFFDAIFQSETLLKMKHRSKVAREDATKVSSKSANIASFLFTYTKI